MVTIKNGKVYKTGEQLPVEFSNGQISPIVNSEKKKKNKDGFFQKSSFLDDGFQALDIAPIAVTSAADIIVNGFEGLASRYEGVMDAVQYTISDVADVVGADTYADQVRNKAKKNTVGNFVAPAKSLIEDASALGDMGRGLSNTLGGVGGMVMENILLPGSALKITGVSAYGSGRSEAYQNNATDGQAFAYGVMNAGVEVISEKIFNGLGKVLNFGKALSSADDVVASKLGGVVRRVTEKAFKSPSVAKAIGNITEYGIKSGAEGVEEVVAGLGNAVAKKLTYESDEDIKKLIKDENLLEQFIIGSIVSGIAQGGDVITSTKQGKDFISGYTDTEQKVVDKVTENRLAEKKKANGKVTAKDKGNVADSVRRDLERGYLTTDEINEALGGDSYKAYKSYADSQKRKETAISAKIEALEKKINTADGETDVSAIREELATERAKLDNLKKTDKTAELKAKLDADVIKLAKGSKLDESYREITRRGENFSADLTKYTAKEQAIVQKAIDSGVLNNTNRTHDFVDFVARVSAAKDIDFDFADNAKIKESGFAVDGAVVNGYVNENGITLNAESVKSLDSVVGHEITHVLEGTELYDSLKSTITEYAKSKGIYDSRLKAIQTLYEGKNADIDAELTADLVGDLIFTDEEFINRLTSNRTLFDKIFGEIKYLARIATAGSKEARQLEKAKVLFEKAYNKTTELKFKDIDGNEIASDRITADENDNSYSLAFNKEIEEAQREYISSHKTNVTPEELAEAQRVTSAMVDVMMEHSEILPEDKVGKVLTKNGSYDISVENTTICVRTLAYNQFVDLVQEKIGRPLSQMESFLVSQKMYDIAQDPQCLYCYVSLDRKAFNDMLLRYMSDRDTVIMKYNNSDKSKESVDQQYQEFLNGRKPTDDMKERFDTWISYADNGTKLLSLADIATNKSQSAIANGSDASLKAQLTDARKYAQKASWAKIQKDYVAYRDEILKLKDNVIKNLNEHYGMRWYSFSDFSPAFIVENMQQITDASIRGLKGLSYTKDTAFAEVFAPSGMNINISVFVTRDKNGNFVIDEKQSADFEEAKRLRALHKNIGIVATVTDDEALRWAGEQEWSDVIIPFHIVRTGTDIAEYYKWLNYTAESGDKIADKDLWDAYVDSLNPKTENARKKVSKNIYPNEHNNNKDTYLNLCESRGLTPRFARFSGESWYMKLVNETRLSAQESTPLKPKYDYDAAERSFNQFIAKGGYEGGWYKEGIDVDAEADVVASDVLSGKKANEVDYGRQDGFAPEDILAKRKQNRSHTQMSLSPLNTTPEGKYTVDTIAYRPKATESVTVDKKTDTISVKNSDLDMDEVAKILDESTIPTETKRSLLTFIEENLLDKGMVFEHLSDETGNRELEAKWQAIRNSERKAQEFINRGADGMKSLNTIRKEVEATGKVQEFADYMYHALNVDRMSLEANAEAKINEIMTTYPMISEVSVRDSIDRIMSRITEDTEQVTIDELLDIEMLERNNDLFNSEEKRRLYATEIKDKLREIVNLRKAYNKPVFGEDVDADTSRYLVEQYEAQNPEFKQFAQEVYDYMNNLRSLMVDEGIITQETADLWTEMYPHYVPIHRADKNGNAVTVPLDTNRTGVNAPIKRATGGNQDINPLFVTMAERTSQTFKAIAKNSFGVELRNTLGENGIQTASQDADLESITDNIADSGKLLKPAENGNAPTFTVFVNGERVTFAINEDMYNALKPMSEKYAQLEATWLAKGISGINNVFRNLVTSWNPLFGARNFAKDVQDVLLNSQHAGNTYKNIPSAFVQSFTHKGHYYDEYIANGGGNQSYFNNKSKTFEEDKTGIAKAIDRMSWLNDAIEMTPRLAEYIASREAGRSIEVSMLDAARVTTNFQAGADLTKFLNRNGATFLNASVQGMVQNIRNVKNAHKKGIKGYAILLSKFALASIPAMLINHFVWGDDEEYEELSDYIKDNYYIVGKTKNGTFIRIPKGRTLSVIQNAVEQVANAATGNAEIDVDRFADLVLNNLAPNNPISDNLIAPIIQTANNKAWHGGDIVPTRLQDEPAAEQYDETTDAFSKWLGQQINVSPYKINYLIDQYSGVIGDIGLPFMTPQAESGAETVVGKAIAPLIDSFTADAVFDNKNSGEFYDTKEELTSKANSINATDEDILKRKFIDSIGADLSELYRQKREIQNSDLSDSEKYKRVKEIQRQINSISEEALSEKDNVDIFGSYAEVSDRQYRLNEDGEWVKVEEKQKAKQDKVTEKLGISPSEYWESKDMYDDAYDNPEKYAVSKVFDFDYATYKNYLKDINKIEGVKDKNGNTINGSTKKEVIAHIQSLPLSRMEKAILFKYTYPKDTTYNKEIVQYLRERTDISYADRVAILEGLGFTVKDGKVKW